MAFYSSWTQFVPAIWIGDRWVKRIAQGLISGDRTKAIGAMLFISAGFLGQYVVPLCITLFIRAALFVCDLLINALQPTSDDSLPGISTSISGGGTLTTEGGVLGVMIGNISAFYDFLDKFVIMDTLVASTMGYMAARFGVYVFPTLITWINRVIYFFIERLQELLTFELV